MKCIITFEVDGEIYYISAWDEKKLIPFAGSKREALVFKSKKHAENFLKIEKGIQESFIINFSLSPFKIMPDLESAEVTLGEIAKVLSKEKFRKFFSGEEAPTHLEFLEYFAKELKLDC